MRKILITVASFTTIFAAAALFRLTFFGHVGPIADADQPAARVMLALALKSFENIGLYGATIALMFGVGWLLAGPFEKKDH